MLDHDEGRDLLIGSAQVVLPAAVQPGRATGAEPPPSRRRIAGGRDRGRGRGRIVDLGNHDALGSEIEDLLDEPGVVGHRPHERRRRGGPQRDQHGLQLVQGDGGVLGVDEDEVESRCSYHLGDEGIGNRQ